MLIIRTAEVIDAPLAAVQSALRSGATWRRAIRAAGGRLLGAPATELADGDLLRWQGWWPGSLRRPGTGGEGAGKAFRVSLQPTDSDQGLPTLSSIGGRPVEISVHATATGSGVLTRVDVLSPSLPAAATAVLRRRVIRAGSLLLGVVTLVAREPSVVVAGALFDGDGRLLVARRGADDPRHPGAWELPGGKVHTGEDERTALAREWREELGVDVAVRRRLGDEIVLSPAPAAPPTTPVPAGGPGATVLRCYQLALGAGQRPEPLEHAELRWVAATELDTLEWLPADRELLPDLRAAAQRGAEHSR
ncbi:(deoxy)nucleoside triphosphate pyrophosphohydrolase [Nakamurella aerolata]|uniref:(deoxy)nucleoside triphosphate pyrophosphohydrolase n=1 Tax=Nakamurella aerolata TaxID=1656892 RepID=UPI0031B64D48